MFREPYLVSMRDFSQVKLEFGDVGFCGGTKSGEPGAR